LLDDRNITLAQEAKQRGMKPYLHTNGDVLKSDDRLCENVINTYVFIVVGLYDYQTNTQLEQAKQYWKDRLKGVNKLEFSTIGVFGIKGADSMGVPKALVPTDSRMAIPDLTYANAPCQRPLIRMIIQHDGEVCNCCEDTSGAFKLGNVYQQSLEDLWFSDHHVQIVQDLAGGNREKYTLCQNCPLPPSTQAPGEKKIAITPRHLTLGKTR
jgi:radical SAM protein with 4Fe4S-binding SPASM domain